MNNLYSQIGQIDPSIINGNGSEVIIRLATMDDIETMTDLHCRSFTPEEHVPMTLGKDYVKATYRWLVTNDDAYALVAEMDQKVVGLVAMCDSSFTKPMFFACLPEFVMSIIKRPSLIFNIRLWKRLFRRPDVSGDQSKRIVEYPNVAQMTIGAVDSNVRGKSIFPKLISATKEYSKNRGARAIRAGVYTTNAPCRRAFVKDGWSEAPELATSDTIFYMAFLDNLIASELGLEYLLTGNESMTRSE